MAFASERASSANPQSSNPVEDGLVKIPVRIDRVLFKNQDNGFFILSGSVPSGHQWPANTIAGQSSPPTHCVFKGTSKSLLTVDPTGEVFDFLGNWVFDQPRNQVQFNVVITRERQPENPDSLLQYLSKGRLKGIGPATARAIVAKWGMQAIQILDNDPGQLSQIQGLTPAKIDKITQAWQEKKALYQLVAFLGLHGLGEHIALQIREANPDMGIETLITKLKDSPYSFTNVEGIGFKTVDILGLSLGLDPASDQRVESALQYLLQEAVVKNGNTAIPAARWADEVAQQLSISVDQVHRTTKKLIDEGKLVLLPLPVPVHQLDAHPRPGYLPSPHPSAPPRSRLVPCVQPLRLAQSEQSIVKDLFRLHNSGQDLDVQQIAAFTQGLASNDALDFDQKKAVWTLLSSPISILTGSPGTGKTTTLRSLVALAQQVGWRVVMAAPTGRAAKRMEEAVGAPASTIHRALKFTKDRSGKYGFFHGSGNPIPGDLFIVDEASMLDSLLTASWLRALPNHARLILVGDPDQLPSVGAGDVLHNLLQSHCFPTARLTRIHRQTAGSDIALTARRILDSQAPAYGGDPLTQEFSFLEAKDNEHIVDSLLATTKALLATGVPASDIQVLSPQKSGVPGTENLNLLLRQVLNPTFATSLAQFQASVDPTDEDADVLPPVLVGERLMQTKNDYDLELFNGDVGVVSALLPNNGAEVEFEGGKTVVLTSSQLHRMLYAYAITVHKSQGGERPVILIPITSSHAFTLNQNLLYTAITRGQRRVVLVGQRKACLLAARKTEQNFRLTGLLAKLKGQFAPLVQPALVSPESPSLPRLPASPVSRPVPASAPTANASFFAPPPAVSPPPATRATPTPAPAPAPTADPFLDIITNASSSTSALATATAPVRTRTVF